MRIKRYISSLIVIGLLVSATANIQAGEEKAPKNALKREQAEKIALEKVPGGKIKDGEMENENGKWIWSFDIATKGTKDITEVQIDAVSGAIIDVATETPADQEKEKQEDAKESKAKEKAPQNALKRQQAEKIALEKVPGGKVKDAEMENENGKWIWSFDIATEGSKNITEVQVDAVSGAIVDIATETPADQEKEKQEDAKEKSEKSEK